MISYSPLLCVRCNNNPLRTENLPLCRFDHVERTWFSVGNDSKEDYLPLHAVVFFIILHIHWCARYTCSFFYTTVLGSSWMQCWKKKTMLYPPSKCVIVLAFIFCQIWFFISWWIVWNFFKTLAGRSTLVPHARPLCYTFSKKLLFPQYNRQSILTSSRVPLTRKPINVLYSDLQLFIILKNRTQIHCLKRDHWYPIYNTKLDIFFWL